MWGTAWRVVLVVGWATAVQHTEMLDLRGATIVVGTPRTPVMVSAAELLAHFALKATGLTLPISNTTVSPPSTGMGWRRHAGGASPKSFIVLTAQSEAEVDRASPKAEGYVVGVNRSTDGVAMVTVQGTDGRGVLFGVGRLVRELNMTVTQNYYTARVCTLALPVDIAITSFPDRPMRGIQMGYRPKTNSYDGLTPELFEDYVRDLILFGINQIELITGSFDDAPYSPHFALSHPDMNTAMSRILAKYHINVSLWYPACHPGGDPNKGCQTGDYNDPTVMAAAVADWDATFSSMTRVDTVFINAGDPGGQSPDDLMMIAQRARIELRKWHPTADLWICPQDWSVPDYQKWAALAAAPEAKEWMAGIIFGPGMPVSLDEFSNTTAPNKYPVRLYPDITHSLDDQIPVPNWDMALHWTQYRETVNPRPLQEGSIAAAQMPYADAGISTYNEGAHDDVNKHVWATVAWGCDTSTKTSCNATELVRERLKHYCRVHFGPEVADDMLDMIYSLEQDWVGPALTNPAINVTYGLLQKVLATMPIRLRWQWRAQQLFYRANYDRLVQARLVALIAGEAAAYEALASTSDPTSAMTAAEAVLDAADAQAEADSAALFVEMRVWAEALFQSIHEQFSVPIYGGEYTRRGANLDTAHLALSDAPFLRGQFATIRKLPTPAAQSVALAQLAAWRDPGVGGFYDDLGQVGAMPHYVHPTFPQNGDQSLQPSPSCAAESISEQYYQAKPESAGGVSDQSRMAKHGHSSDPPQLPTDTRRTTMTWIETLRPLTKHLAIRLKYPQLPPATVYNVSVTGLSDDAGVVVWANGGTIFNGTIGTLGSEGVWTLGIPPVVTKAGGDLLLAFAGRPSASTEQLGFYDVGEGIKLAEAWLRVVH